MGASCGPGSRAGPSFSAALVITDRRAPTSNIVATDVLTSNGVIHVIDRVILPAPCPLG
jgi:uncharacterized surface protein with fasciclin (FAS1) repeats